MAEPTSLRFSSASTVSLTTSSAQSAAIGTANSGQPNATTVCRLVADAACWIEIAADPTAVAESAGAVYLPAGVPEYIDVPLGHKIAGILASGTGKLNIAVCAHKGL